MFQKNTVYLRLYLSLSNLGGLLIYLYQRFFIYMSEELLYEISLSQLAGIGAVTARQLISYCGSAEEVFRTPSAKLVKIPNIGAHIANKFKEKPALDFAEKCLKIAEREGVKVLSFRSKDYPQRLKHIYDAPLVLFYKGEAELNAVRSVGIVGTRDASDYGKQFTEELVQDLQKYDPLIVSGLAYGIDIAAHRAALRYHLPTIGVMASGLDIIYPAVHKNTAFKMIEQGGLLSENPFGTKPDASRFPARNRVIAGLVDAVIVVEAKAKGGALITANLANDYNREVLAVPGSVYQQTAAGCHQLIKQNKAHLLSNVEDLVKLMQWEENSPKSRSVNLHLNFADLSASEQKIVAVLQNAPQKTLQIDQLAGAAQLPIAEIHNYLLNLELLGLVKALPGSKYSLFA